MMSQSYEKVNILVAYPYMKKSIYETLRKYKNHINLLVDSGAFTANSKGKVISVDEYCEFIKSLNIPVWRYFTLDVIGNPEKTMIQYRQMLDKGFHPIPIFTQGQTLEAMEEYYRTSDLIGVGTLVGTKGNREYVKYLMKKIAGRKVHWLGFTRLDYIKKFKPFSCDCSSQSIGARYGILHLYMGNGMHLSLRRKHFIEKPSQPILNRISYYGYDPKDLSKSDNWKKTNTLVKLCAASYVSLMLDIKKNLNTNLFLACGSTLQVELIMKEYFYQTKQKVA